ncbi:MAG: Cof-type HAD-IIB family hydrolase [Finegoldia sp.]|nr:Cof-type HAD-IIB family hydrolase [Finegoldia sp.]
MDHFQSTKSHIKLVLFDLDGTFLNDRKQVLDSSIQALEFLKEKGIRAAFATGRDIELVDDLVIKNFKLDHLIDYVIADNGAKIKDCSSDKAISRYFLQVDQLLKIKDHFKDLKLVYGVGEKGYYFVSGENALTRYTNDVLGLPVKVVDFDSYLTEPKPKFLLFVPSSKQMEKVMDLYQSLDLEGVVGIRSSKNLFEFNHKNVNKARAIADLCDYIGIGEEETMAFGDEMNDLAMLKSAGVSVAMGNASDELKAQADFVTDDNNNHGIAKFIYNYFQ